MATSARKAKSTPPSVAGEVLSIPTNLIDPDIAGRIGLYYPIKIEGLASRIAVDGQLEPIWVRLAPTLSKFSYVLIAGRTRLDACEMLERPVLARVFDGTDADFARLQANQKLDRRELSVLERAMYVAAVAEAAQQRLAVQHGSISQQTLAGKARAARCNLHRAANDPSPERGGDVVAEVEAEAGDTAAALDKIYGWREQVRDACGLSLDAVKRALTIHRCLVLPHRDLIDAIKDHPIVNNQRWLLKICALAEPGRAEALRALAAQLAASAGGSGQACALAGLTVDGVASGAEPPSNDRAMVLVQRAVSLLDRMAEAEREAFVEERALTLGVAAKRRLVARLNAELGIDGGKK
jgi:ParB-like chromosome segregation protein Spo0J